MTYRGEIIMKRQLDSKYKDLVNYVNEQKRGKVLVSVLDDVIRQAKDCYNPGSKLWIILEELYTTCLYDNEIIDLVETIIDIYNSNYELQQPKHMYRLADINSDKGAIYLTLKDDYYTLQVWSDSTNKYQELTDKQFQKFLSQHTKFTANMFGKLEV